jgi:RsiW-degrading membrane proteinase PrsW (M82 family)
MQVEPVSTSLVALPELSQSILSVAPSQTTGHMSEPISTTEESEQPTFHVMQPPLSTSIVPSEPTVAQLATTYAQLVAVPIAAEQSLVSNAPTAPNKPTKRVFILLSLYFAVVVVVVIIFYERNLCL